MTTAFTATYRLQLHAGFTFDDARAVVPYLARLGVSHVYLSPVLTARPGSAHGYDVADPRAANPELGGDDGFRRLAEAAHAHGLGVLVDIVPNHMGVGPANPFWMDVLRWGRDSRYARVFDIDWDIPGRAGVLLLPVLGDERAAVLARGELALGWRDGEFRVTYFEHEWPLDPRTVHRVLALEHARELSAVAAAEIRAVRDALFAEGGASLGAAEAAAAVRALGMAAARSPEIAEYVRWLADAFTAGDDGRFRFEALLDLQPWRLAHWRRAARELNYRRFFDVGELAAVRVEDPAVFDVTHAWTLDRIAERLIDGVRVDHVDGLRDPRAYLERLRTEIDVRRPGEALPLLVEKILSPGEHLPARWPTDGTTGYEYLNDLESLFVSPDGLRTLDAAYRRLLRIGDRLGFHDVAARGKELVLRRAFDTDLRRLVRQLDPAARAVAPRLPRPMVHEAALQMAVGLPVYRTYVRPVGSGESARLEADADDYRWIGEAHRRALGGGADRFALQFVADVLRGEWPPVEAPVSMRARLAARDFALRFQQTSGPATAKGVEDTALYRWYPLASLNEVGGDPARARDEALATFHAGNAERVARWPRQLLAVETHDTKRSADVRARLDALSDVAEEWIGLVTRWRRRHAPLRRMVGRRAAPDANAEYLLYQTLVGVWPEDGEPGAHARAAVCARVTAYMQKAAREAKAQTSWTDADAAYEAALGAFASALVEQEPGGAFRAELGALVDRVARAGYWTGLARVVLQAASPGTPDVYQGGELWSLALVDPDNRRPVDFERRRALLDAAGLREGHEAAVAEWAESPADGRVKLHVLASMLRLRRERPALLAAGGYAPLPAHGRRAGHVAAFTRSDATGGVLVLAGLRPLALRPDGGAPVGPDVWGDTLIRIPALADGELVDVLSGAAHQVASDGRILLGEIFATLPVACLRW